MTKKMVFCIECDKKCFFLKNLRWDDSRKVGAVFQGSKKNPKMFLRLVNINNFSNQL